MSVKLSRDMIKPFNGEGDLVAWLSKVKLVAKLQEVKDLSAFVPLFLEGSSWDDYVGDCTVAMVREMLDRVKRDDPVKGSWAVPKTSSGLIWCDASSIAMGVLVERDNMVVEDAAWLRKKTDFNHINVAKLEAV